MTEARIYDKGVNKRIGTLDANARSFCKQVKGSKHLMQVLDAWGIDKLYFDAYLLPRNYTIEVYDQETSLTYKTDAATFHKLGTVNDFGYKAQIFLPRRYWQTTDPKAKEPEGMF